MSGTSLNPDRRQFLGQLTLAVGGIALSGVALARIAPTSLLAAAPACLVDAAAYPDPCGDWSVDDMCGAYPPYAFDTGAARPHSVPLPGDAVGADHHWIG
jgi:hypothetical protein